MRTFLPVISLCIVWLSGCASSSHSGGGRFKPSQNDRVTVTSAGLQTVSLDGNYYVRWAFSIQPKQPIEFRSIRVEDVSGPQPVLIINDVAPQLQDGKWTGSGGMIELTPTGLPWLFDERESLRVFQFTITEMDGRAYVLQQSVPYSKAAKAAVRKLAQVSH
jgi:hypothetical protein